MTTPEQISPRPPPKTPGQHWLWAVALVLILFYVAYLIWDGNRKRALLAGERMNAAGITWLVKEVKTAELWGQLRVDLSLAILRAPSARVALDGNILESICSAALAARERLGINMRRSQVFQTRISILGAEMQPTETQHVPVNVVGGRCELTEKRGFFFPRYPAPLQGWILRGVKYPDGTDGGQIDFWFVWAGEGGADLSAFPYQKACEAAVSLPALPEIESYLHSHPVRKVGIVAASERTVLLVPISRWQGHVYESVGRACGVQLHEVKT